MNAIIESLHTRKSVRAFEDKPIPEDIESEILIAATQAPTAGNQQLYTILDITDQDLKDRLAVTCDNQPFIAKAPLVLIFCADAQKWLDVYLEGGCSPRKPGAGDLMLAVCDATIAAQNAVTAAWSFGIGSCYIGDIMERCEEHRELLKLPDYVFPAAMLVFGYPSAQQLRREKPTRCDLEHMLTILSSFAQEESRSVSENCKWRLKEQMKQGKLVGLRRMYGYEVHRDGVSIRPEQAATVQRIFQAYVNGGSSIEISRQLVTENVPTLNGGTWSSKYVRDILTNEKYTGDALLQKTYISDHLTKRRKRNKGELPKFYSAGSHEAIIDRETFERAQALLAERGEYNKPKTPTNTRYPFTGKIICGVCGRHYQRKRVHEKSYWLCATYLVHGKAACPAKQIPENVLLEAAAEALGLEAFLEQEFESMIAHIEVPEQYHLRFVLTDGQIFERTWEHRSRSESWTDEMKQHARKKDRERRNTDPCPR